MMPVFVSFSSSNHSYGADTAVHHITGCNKISAGLRMTVLIFTMLLPFFIIPRSRHLLQSHHDRKKNTDQVQHHHNQNVRYSLFNGFDYFWHQTIFVPCFFAGIVFLIRLLHLMNSNTFNPSDHILLLLHCKINERLVIAGHGSDLLRCSVLINNKGAIKSNGE